MGVTRKRSASEARGGNARPEKSYPKKEYPKKEGGEQKAKKTALVCDLQSCFSDHRF
jgi:ribosome biogenesis protein MAK21